MIDLSKRIPSEEVVYNGLYYQDLGLYPISDYRSNIEDSSSYPAQMYEGSYIDFSDDALDGTQSLVIYPPKNSRDTSNPYNYCTVKINLVGSQGRGLFWSNGSTLKLNYKKLDASATINVRIRNEVSGGQYSSILTFSSGNVGEWVSAEGTFSWYGSGGNRNYMVIEVSNGRVMLDALMLTDYANIPFTTNTIDKTLYDVLLEGAERRLKLTIGNSIVIPDDQNGYVLDEGSVSLTNSLWENGLFGGCIASQLTASVMGVSPSINGQSIVLTMNIRGDDYTLFTGWISSLEKHIEEDWYDIKAYDAIGKNQNKDITEWYTNLFKTTGIPELLYRGEWNDHTAYPKNSVVLYNNSYYQYSLSDWDVSRFSPVTFDGVTYTNYDSLLRAFKGHTPPSITVEKNGSARSLPVLIYDPYPKQKTYKSEYKGLWVSSKTYARTDVVKYQNKYYRYGRAMDWTVNGVAYSTLVKGVAPIDIPEQFRDVATYLIIEEPDYDIYEYPLADLEEFVHALMAEVDIPICLLDFEVMYEWGSRWKIMYDPSLTKLTFQTVLREVCQLGGLFGYINEIGEFAVLWATNINSNTVDLGLNYEANKCRKDLKEQFLEQVKITKGKDKTKTEYAYPVSGSFFNVFDLTNNKMAQEYLEHYNVGGSGTQYVYDNYHPLEYTPISIEEIVGVFIGIGYTVNVTLQDGTSLSFPVSKVTYKGSQLVDQTIECVSMFK